MIDPAHPSPVMADLIEATRRLESAEWARSQALHAWEVSDEPYPLSAAVALEAAERDLRLARAHLQSIQTALASFQAAAARQAEDEKAWSGH